MSSHRRMTLTAMLASVLVLGACASIPSSGQVQAGDPQIDEVQNAVAVAEGPVDGATSRSIVEGFLLAGAAGLTGDYVVARQFLDEAAVVDWDPLAGATVTSSTTLEQVSDSQITANLEVVGKIDDEGRYTEQAGTAESLTYDLVKTAGQWRISDPPSGLVISQRVFEQQYREAPVYFLTADTAELVPDVRYFPSRNLATSVVRALLDGPSPWLTDVVVTAIPDGVRLKPEAVRVTDNVAEVVLEPAHTVQTAPNRDLMLAQITRSLDLVGISEVEVRAGQGGALLEGPAQFPDTVAGSAVMLSGDQVLRLGTDPTPVEGVGSLTGLDASAPAMNDDGSLLVMLSGRNQLIRAPTVEGTVRTLLEGEDLAAPSVDRSGWVWTASDVAGSGVLTVDDQGTVRSVSAVWLSDRTVKAVRVSREGSRVAVVSTGPDGLSIDVAGVLRDSSMVPLSLGPSVRVGAGLVAADQVVWAGPTTIITLGRVSESAVLTRVEVPGTSEALTPVTDAVWVATDRNGLTLMVATATGGLQRYYGRTWIPVSGVEDARDPCYSG